MAAGRHEHRAQRGPGDERDVERHVVEREHPAPVAVVHLLLQDRGRADSHALPGQVQPEPDDQERGLVERLAQRADHHRRAGQQQRDPGGLAHPLGDLRGDQCGAGVAHRRDDDQHKEVAERGVGAGRPVEVVAVEQDRHQEQDPVQEAVAAGGAQRGGRPAAPRDIPGPGHQAGQHTGQLAAQPARLRLARAVDGPEQIGGHGPGDQAGQHVAQPPDQQGDGRAALAAAGEHVHAEADDPADRGHDPARGRGHRVGHHQLVPGHHVRQRGRQRGQEEPVDPEHQQDADVQRYPELARGHQPGGERHEQRAQQRGPDQDLAARPAVDEHPGERADQRVGQVQHGERGRGRGRVGERGVVEEHVRAEAGGEHPVAGLRDQPGREQPPEIPLAEHDPQVGEER